MYALKIETASIQRYIFSSNKLKVNLGASYIIEHLLFNDLLQESVHGITNAKTKIESWHLGTFDTSTSIVNANFEVGFIGGGNALLFGSKENLQLVELKFKHLVLQSFPGLEIYSGLVNIENKSYQEYSEILNKTLNENRAGSPFINRTFNHGFYNSCAISGGAAMKKWETEDKWVSDEVFSKIQYCEGNGGNIGNVNDQHEVDLFEETKRNAYTFPLNFEDFNADSEKSYIAIVHIDGNNLGQEFINSMDIETTRKLSLAVKELGRETLKQTIQKGIIEKIDEYKIGHIKLNLDNNKIILPIRPIITGGDDITFICEGTLGVPLAKLFLDIFTEKGKGNSVLQNLEDGVHACAGVAIVKQKYPFYRGYELSEELIKEAKKASRKVKGSYLSAIIAGYGTGTSLKELKEQYATNKLYKQTFQVLANDQNSGLPDESGKYDSLLKLMQLFNESDLEGRKKVPRNKLIEVRNGLTNNNLEKVWSMIKSRLKDTDQWDPTNPDNPVFDAIELVDFYNEAYYD